MKRGATFALGAACGALLLALALLVYERYKTTRVHLLEAPMVLRADGMDQQLHLLPKGTTLYYDRGFAEGFQRYKVYINIDRTPLPLKTLDDASMVAPIDAASMDHGERQRAQDARAARVLTQQDLEAILASGSMRRGEIEALLAQFARKRQ
jgi:hypothetical protein